MMMQKTPNIECGKPLGGLHALLAVVNKIGSFVINGYKFGMITLDNRLDNEAYIILICIVLFEA